MRCTARQACACILSMPGRGTATSEHLAVYGLDATPKDRHQRRRQQTRSRTRSSSRPPSASCLSTFPGNGDAC